MLSQENQVSSPVLTVWKEKKTVEIKPLNVLNPKQELH